MNQELKIVMYHYTRDLVNSRYPQIKALDTKLFRQQLAFFNEKYNVVTMEQVLEAIGTKEANLPSNALLLTFDDGYIDNFITAFPLLKELNMQGSFFVPGKTIDEHCLLDVNKIHFVLASAEIERLVPFLKKQMDYYRGRENEYMPTDELYAEYAVANRWDNKDTIFFKRMLQTVLPERVRKKILDDLYVEFVDVPETVLSGELYMNREQVRFMKSEGMHIGVHGYDHNWMNRMTEEDFKTDIDCCLESMGEFIDRDNWVINYPYGGYNDSVISYVKTKGCKLGLTVQPGCVKFEEKYRYELPRFDCNDFYPVKN